MSPTNTSWACPRRRDRGPLRSERARPATTISPSSPERARRAVVRAARPRSCPAFRSAATEARISQAKRWRTDRPQATSALFVVIFFAALFLRSYRLELPTACTSTRSTTPGRRPSSCRTGVTASSIRSTSTRTRTSPSTRWPSASRLFGDNKVVSTAQLEGPVTDAALETRWSPPSRPAERDGDRMYVVNGHGPSGLRPREPPAHHDHRRSTSPRRPVAVDDDGHQLYIALGRRHDQPARHDRLSTSCATDPRPRWIHRRRS